MAFQTGSQINPALGRIDYTPYMQGAVAGAQSIGQGIASLGQSIGSGIEQFYKKKEQKQQEDQATAFVGNLVKSDPQVAKFLGLQPSETGEYDEKALRAGIKTVGAPAILNLANNFQMLEQEQLREQALRQQGIEANKAFGEIVSQFTDPKTGKFNLAGAANAAAQRGLAPKAVLDYAETQAKTATGASMPVMTLEQAQAQANAMASASGKDFIGKTLYDEKTGGYTPSIVQKPAATFAPPTEVANAELRATSIKGRIDEERSAYKAATSGASNARLIQKAFESGKVTTGTFGKVSGYLKTLGESIGLGDLGATEQNLAIQGINALQADKVRGIMQGLGAMSNADREFATASMPTIANPEINIKYYVELAKENERLAKEDQAFIRKLEREGNVPQEEIFRRLDEVRENRVGVAESIYNRVVGATTPAPAPAPAGGGMKIGRFNVIQSQ